MNLRAFKIRLVEKEFVMLDDHTFLFRRKKGRWEVWESDTNKSKTYPSIEEASKCRLSSGSTVMDLIGKLTTLDIPLQGGRGSGSGTSKVFKFGHANDKGAPGGARASDLPARINVRTKTKSVESIIKTFRRQVEKDPNREHGITTGDQGFATQYVHGNAHSVSIGAKNRGEIVIHNHPNNSSFSDADLISTASQRSARGVVATYNKGYRIFTKGTHFNGEAFTKAVRTASPRGKDYNDAVDRWLTRNQKKYDYKFKNVKD